MPRVKVVWKRNVFRTIRAMPAVQNELAVRAGRIADAAGPGYAAGPVRETGGRGRARVTVKTVTTTARRRESRDHILLKAINAGKG